MRITSKGQVTVPIEIRERAGFLPGTEVEFVVVRDSIRIVRKTGDGRSPGRGARAVARLRGTASAGLSTDDILALTRRR